MHRILNIIGYLGTALVVAAVGFRIFGPPVWDRYAMYMAWAGLVCVLLYPIAQWREIAAQFNRRQARYASVALTSVVIMLGILIAVNYLSNRRHKRWDLTANSVHTLSAQSQKVLAGLDSPLKITLFDQSLRFENYRDRMSQYENASRQVSVEYVDGETDPVRARKFEVQAFPTLVLEYKGKTEKVQSVDEREITSAVIRVISGKQRKAYFVQGHGERDPAGDTGLGYGSVARLLKGDNVTVEPLTLSQSKDIPQDATVLVIAGPTADFLDEEIEQLRRYLSTGGKIMLTVDPGIGERVQPLTRLTALAHDWGISIDNDVIIDLSVQRPEITIAQPPYPPQAITEGFRVATAFPLARSLSAVTPPPQGKTVQPFVASSARAWAETDLAGLTTSEPEMNTDKGDKAGPVNVAIAATTPAPPPDAKPDDKTPPQARFVVFGDTDFASNAFAGQLGNVDLFLNTVNWLTAQENLISIRPKEPGNSRLTITPTQMNVVWWLSVAGIPAAVFAVGIFGWTRRRRS